jgi:CopG family nickel-responsive transcriptional regulator
MIENDSLSPDPEMPMDRFTISLEQELAAAFDEFIKQRGYKTRSEAVRDIVRDRLQHRDLAQESHGFCIACLSYVYNHHARQLSERLAKLQHAHHDLTVATMHVHLDHEQCLETLTLKGPEKGVRHGQLNLVSVDRGEVHEHDGTRHRHLTPRH